MACIYFQILNHSIDVGKNKTYCEQNSQRIPPTPLLLKLNYLPLEQSLMNDLPICKSTHCVWASCKVSLKSVEWCRRRCAYKLCGQTDGQTTGWFLYTPQTMFAGGIIIQQWSYFIHFSNHFKNQPASSH